MENSEAPKVAAPFYWSRALLAALIAGAVDAILVLLMALAYGRPLTEAVRPIAAILLGAQALSSEQARATILISAAAVHIGLSLFYGVIVIWAMKRFVQPLQLRTALVLGALAGFAMYAINYFVIAPIAFPWFIAERGVIATLVHPVFGVVAAASYVWLARQAAHRP